MISMRPPWTERQTVPAWARISQIAQNKATIDQVAANLIVSGRVCAAFCENLDDSSFIDALVHECAGSGWG